MGRLVDLRHCVDALALPDPKIPRLATSALAGNRYRSPEDDEAIRHKEYALLAKLPGK